MRATNETSHSDTTDDTNELTITATVAIRIPRKSDDDLVTAARQRLERTKGVDSVAIRELHAVEPRLSAIRITAAIIVDLAAPRAKSAVQVRLGDTLGVDVLESNVRQEADSM